MGGETVRETVPLYVKTVFVAAEFGEFAERRRVIIKNVRRTVIREEHGIQGLL
jgi:hypothetical protein